MSKELLGVALLSLILTGCGLREDYKQAAENYIHAKCAVVVNVVMWFAAFDGTVEGTVQYDCAEEDGVNRYRFKISDIPAKYWAIKD